MKRIFCLIMTVVLAAAVPTLPAVAEGADIVEISNAEELLAIDGTVGGTYILTDDIDMSGASRKPLDLSDTIIDGDGHAVKNLTITGSFGAGAVGLIGGEGQNNVVTNMDLENVKIDITANVSDSMTVSPIGNARAENCSVSGTVKMGGNIAPPEGGHADLSVFGLNNAEDCMAELDITVNARADEDNAVTEAYGIDNGTNCYFEGGINSSGNACGIKNGTDCYFEGDINSSGGAGGIKSGTDCYFEGNINAANGSGYAIVGEVNNECMGCYFVGDIKFALAEKDSGFANHPIISKASDSVFIGDVTAKNMVVFECVYQCENCYFEGDINCKNISAVHAIRESNNCSIVGNIRADGTWELAGIAFGSGCCLIGDMFLTNDSYSHVSDCDSGNYYSGNITANVCGKTLAPSAPGNHHICEKGHYFTNNEDFTLRCSIDGCDATSIINVSRRASGTAAMPEPPEPTADNYALQVVDEVTEQPIAGAEVTIKGEKHTADQNGVVKLNESRLIRDMEVAVEGEKVHSDKMYIAKNDSVNTVEVNAFDLDKEDIFSGNDQSVTIKGPSISIAGKEFSIFELPYSFSTEDLFENVKVAYNKTDKSYEVLLGDYEDIGKDTPEGKPENAESDEWREMYDEVADIYEKAVDSTVELDEIIKAGDLFKPKKKSFGFEADMSAGGFLKFKGENGKLSLVDGGFVVAASAEFSGGYPLPPAPYVFIAFGLKGEAGASAKFELKKAVYSDPELDMKLDMTAALSPRLGVGVGLKKAASAEIGLEGSIENSLRLPMKSLEENAVVELKAKLYYALQFLCFAYEDSIEFAGTRLWPRAESISLASIDGPEDLKPVTRDYLGGASAADELPGTFKADIYPYSEVQTADLGEEGTLVVWLDDDASRTANNRTALYYSIEKDGVMTQPKQIDADGTADFEFSLTADYDKAAIAWQNASEPLTDNDDLDSAAKKIDISYAEFENSAWSEPIDITSGNDYEYSPRIGLDYSTAYVLYTTNNENSGMPGVNTTGETVRRTEIAYGEARPSEVVYDDLPIVYDTAVDSSGNMLCYAEKSGGGKVLYNNQDEADSGDGITGIYSGGSNLYYTKDGTLRELSYSSIYEYAECPGAESMALVGDDAVIYEVSDGFKSNLYASFRNENYEWEKPVPITDLDEKIRSYSADIDDNGNITIYAVLAKVDPDNNIAGETRLAVFGAEAREDIVLAGAEQKGSAAPGETAALELMIANNTSKDLSEVSVTVTGSKAGELYSGSAAADIPAGEYGTAEIDFDIPPGFEAQDVSVTVSAPLISETDMSNNTASAFVGGANIAAEIDGSALLDTGKVKIRVRSAGAEPVDNITVTLTAEDGTELFSRNIVSLAGGDETEFEAEVDPSLYNFTESYESLGLTAEAECAAKETTKRDNIAMLRISSEKAMALRLPESEVTLRPGASYRPAIGFYPEISVNSAVYAYSSDESVAVAADDGTVSAKANGTAVITYISPQAKKAAALKVIVSDTAPEPTQQPSEAPGSPSPSPTTAPPSATTTPPSATTTPPSTTTPPMPTTVPPTSTTAPPTTTPPTATTVPPTATTTPTTSTTAPPTTTPSGTTTPPSPTSPTASPAPDQKISNSDVVIQNGVITVSTSLDGLRAEDREISAVLAALYDENGAMIDICSTEYDGADVKSEFEYRAGADHIKVFVWNKDGSLKPLTDVPEYIDLRS